MLITRQQSEVKGKTIFPKYFAEGWAPWFCQCLTISFVTTALPQCWIKIIHCLMGRWQKPVFCLRTPRTINISHWPRFLKNYGLYNGLGFCELAEAQKCKSYWNLNKFHCQLQLTPRKGADAYVPAMPRVAGRKSPSLCMHTTLQRSYGSWTRNPSKYQLELTWETVPLSQLTDTQV